MKDISLDFEYCPRCGRDFKDKEVVKTKHHAVPMFMKPKYEVRIPLCRDCHNELNGCYVHTKKKEIPPSKKKLKTLLNHAEGLQGTLMKYQKKLNKYITEVKITLGEELKEDKVEVKQNG